MSIAISGLTFRTLMSFLGFVEYHGFFLQDKAERTIDKISWIPLPRPHLGSAEAESSGSKNNIVLHHLRS
jgi:hypothetical protein